MNKIMSQSLSKIILHIIFSTKDRFDFLTDEKIKQETHSFLAGILNTRGATCILVGGTSNHVHILSLQSKKELISKTIGEGKRASTLWLKDKSPLLSKFHWQNGYGVFSVSESNVEIVKKYILNQEEHHKTSSYKDEFRSFLKKYNIEYDEKYVWD